MTAFLLSLPFFTGLRGSYSLPCTGARWPPTAHVWYKILFAHNPRTACGGRRACFVVSVFGNAAVVMVHPTTTKITTTPPAILVRDGASRQVCRSLEAGRSVLMPRRCLCFSPFHSCKVVRQGPEQSTGMFSSTHAKLNLFSVTCYYLCNDALTV